MNATTLLVSTSTGKPLHEGLTQDRIFNEFRSPVDDADAVRATLTLLSFKKSFKPAISWLHLGATVSDQVRIAEVLRSINYSTQVEDLKTKIKGCDIKHTGRLTAREISELPHDKVYDWVKTGHWKLKDFQLWLRTIRVID